MPAEENQLGKAFAKDKADGRWEVGFDTPLKTLEWYFTPPLLPLTFTQLTVYEACIGFVLVTAFMRGVEDKLRGK